MMNGEYRAHLEAQGVPENAIVQRVALVGDMLAFLADIGADPAAADMVEAEAFAGRLIAEGRNSLENFQRLCDYAAWRGDRSLYVALVELMDCHNALEVLAGEIIQRHGKQAHDQIFVEPLPPLGAGEEERCAYARSMTERMSKVLSLQEARDAWYQVQHGIPAEVWRESDLAERKKFLTCRDVDDYLALRRRERNEMLTRLRDEGELWYTQEITDEALAFITSDPEMEGGLREGNRVYITKVPYDVAGYLAEPDPRLKRNHVCHCPMLREAIRQDISISPEVCNCSLGHASHYLAALGVEVEGHVLESVLKGDARCRFVFILPDETDEASD